VVTAKIKCNLKQEYIVGGNGYVTLGFMPDYAAGRNAEWAHSTPHLDLRMTVKAEVAPQFEVGKSYTLQFIDEE
jgi:hypothetical protein